MKSTSKMLLALGFSGAALGSTWADQVRVFAPSVVRASIGPIIEKFEASTGNTVEMNYGGTGLLLKKLADGEKADIVVLPQDKVQAMTRKGEVDAASVKPIGAVGIGVAIRQGAPVPDISTVESFKQLLLNAPHIAAIAPANSTSGKHVAQMLESLQIKEQVAPKMILVQQGFTAEKVAKGEADIAIQQITEILPVKGAQLVGPLPEPLQETTIYTVGVRSNAQALDAAQKFAADLTSAAALQEFKAHGFAPVPTK